MKRILLVLLLVLVLGGGGAAWWYLRDTPEKVLRDGAQALAAMKSVGTVSAEISRTDIAARTTSGYSIEGQIDAADLSLVRGLGVVRVGAKTQQGQDETLDVVVNSSAIAFRPNDVTAEHRAQYAKLVGSSTGTTFLLFDRAAFLEKYGYGEGVAKGASKDIRATLQFVLPTISPDGTFQQSELNSRSVVTAGFRFNRNELRAFLIALIKSWTGKSPTPDEYAWVERTSEGLSRGTWALSLDRSTRLPVQITGSFPVLDDRSTEKQRIRFTFDLSDINAPVAITTPSGAKDLTSLIRPSAVNALPGSETRALPEGFVAPQASGEAQENQIDLFTKFQEEIKRKKKMY